MHKHSNVMLWHNRLGHLHVQKLHYMSLVDCNHDSFVDYCSICFKSKQHRSPFPNSISTTNNLFERIHVDVWGP